MCFLVSNRLFSKGKPKPAILSNLLKYRTHHYCTYGNLLKNSLCFMLNSLNIPDLRPNVGLFWYFFTEMFEHFRTLFVCAFQLNASLLYVAPLSLRLHREPLLLATSLTALAAIFRSYPSVGDVGFYLALLPMWKHLFHC